MASSADRFDWNDIPILVALAHSGSMRTAARHLGVTTSTVSRRLAAAERAIQTRLFVRGSDGYKPTDTGRMFLAEAEQIEGSVHALLSDTNRDSEAIKGPVRITSVDVMLNDWLIPRLPDLRSIYPEIEIQVIADNQVLSFNRGECDLALRAARPREDASILMRKIGTVGVAVYGARSFKRPSRNRWSELPWLAFNEDLMDAVETKWLARNVPAAAPKFRCSSMSGLIRACEAGLGLALLPCFAVDRTPLVRLSKEPEFQRDIYLLSHRQAGKIRRFKTVADWIAKTASDDGSILSGK